jgi:hypothetical protein
MESVMSSVTISSSTIEKAYKLYVKARDRNIEERINRRIDVLIEANRKKRSKWHGFFTKELTREEARTILNTSDHLYYYSEIALINRAYNKSDRVFDQLLNACSVADEINVSTDDLAVIGPWIRGEK